MEVICRQLQIICIKAVGVSLKCSLCFIPSPLASFPKMFDIDEEKGYFPFLVLNKWPIDNQPHPYPPPSDYLIDGRKPQEREEFFIWYNSVKHNT